MTNQLSAKGPSTERFPVGRTFVSLIAVSMITPLAFILPAMWHGRLNLREWALLPVVSIVYAWPGCITFLLLGLPTIYGLFRFNRTGYLPFILFGALYTAVPWIILQGLLHPPRARFLQLVPLFAIIGIVNGLLTRLIIFGRRS